MRDYKKAYKALVDQGVEANVFEGIFGQPRQVEPFTIPGKELPVNSNDPYVDAVFDVPSNGWPRDIIIVSTNPQGDASLNVRGKHAVAATRYRPRFEQGKPVDTKGINLRYVFRN